MTVLGTSFPHVPESSPSRRAGPGCVVRSRTMLGSRPEQGWSAVRPVVTTTTLVTQDGVPVDTVHLPAPRDDAADGAADHGLVIVIAHGFTQSWQNHMVWPVAKRFNAAAGVVTFDFRAHGPSGGPATLGDNETYDLDVAPR